MILLSTIHRDYESPIEFILKLPWICQFKIRFWGVICFYLLYAGFTISDTACCGTGGTYKGLLPCTPLSSLCTDRTNYVFWDPYHTSDKANVILSNRFFYGDSSFARPMNIQQLALLNLWFMLPSLVSRLAVSLSNYHCKVLEGLVNKLLASPFTIWNEGSFSVSMMIWCFPRIWHFFLKRSLLLNSFFLEESWYFRSEGLLGSIYDSGLLLRYDRDVV